MLIIDLIRHAESEWVRKAKASPIPLFGGRMNKVDLSDVGRGQAVALGMTAKYANIWPDAFYTSPAKRARRTHKLSVRAMDREDATATVLGDLQEMSWGKWEGQPRSIRHEQPFREQWQQLGMRFAPPGGESYAAVQARAMRALRQIVRQTPEGLVWVHTHRNVIKAVAQPWSRWTLEEMTQAELGETTLTRLAYERGRFRLIFFGQPISSL